MFIIIIPLNTNNLMILFSFIYYYILGAKKSVWQMIGAEEIFVQVKSRIGDTGQEQGY